MAVAECDLSLFFQNIISIVLRDENVKIADQDHYTIKDIFIVSDVHFSNLCQNSNFLRLFLNFFLYERKVLGETNVFLKLRFVCKC